MGGCRSLAVRQLHNKESTDIKEAALPSAFLYQYSSIVVSMLAQIINPAATHTVPAGISASDLNVGVKNQNSFHAFCFKLYTGLLQGFHCKLETTEAFKPETGHLDGGTFLPITDGLLCFVSTRIPIGLKRVSELSPSAPSPFSH